MRESRARYVRLGRTVAAAKQKPVPVLKQPLRRTYRMWLKEEPLSLSHSWKKATSEGN